MEGFIMTVVECEITWCRHNENGTCTADKVEVYRDYSLQINCPLDTSVAEHPKEVLEE